MQYFCTRIQLYINNLRIFSISNQPIKNETQKSAPNIYVPSAPKETPIPFFFAFICNKKTCSNFVMVLSNLLKFCLPCLLFDSDKRQTHLIIMRFQKLTFFIWKPQQKVCLLWFVIELFAYLCTYKITTFFEWVW